MEKGWGGLAERMELPENLLSGVPRLTLTGSRQILIENLGELLCYTDEILELACGKQRFRISGSSLQLRTMDHGELLISGRIAAIEVDG